MKNTKTKNAASVTTKVAPQSLTYVSGQARSEGNISRAKAVNGMSVEKALAHYATIYPKGAKTHLNYDIDKIGSLVLK
tara:strand:+ start:1042 stop:1275 length:234 start_codon:yes stop_codon:yes gene_type:complete